MPAYQARYTCSGELQQSVVDFIMRNAQKYIIAREVASREHIQCYVETQITKKTWDNKFKLKFPEMDRRDKYFKEDKGSTIRYVCKDNDILVKLGFSDDDIEKFHTEYHQQNPKPEISLNIEENLILLPEPKEEKTKKPKPPTFMRQCRNELEEEFPNLEFQKKHRRLVFLKVMNNLGEQCKNLDKFIIIRMVNGVLNSLIKNKKEWHEHWYQECFNELLYDKDGHVEIDETEDQKVDETEDQAKAYIEQIKKENEEAEKEILDRLKNRFFNSKNCD